MASIDALAMAVMKEYSTGQIPWRCVIPVVMLVYSMQPLVFLKALEVESMTVMNLLWDVLSDLFVTLLGMFYFKEFISPIKRVGLAFAFVAIVLLSYDTVENSK